MGMIGVLEIALIVPTLRVGMPLRTLRVRFCCGSQPFALAVTLPQHSPARLLFCLSARG